MTKVGMPKTYSFSRPKVPKEEAILILRDQIGIGRAIRDANRPSMVDLESSQKRRIEWLENNMKVLSRLFNNSFIEEEFSIDIPLDIDNAITFGLKEKYFKDDIDEQIKRLESILERLEQEKEEKPLEEPMRLELLTEIHPNKAPFRREPPMGKPSIEKLPKKELFKELAEKEKPLQERPSREATRGRRLLKEEPPSTGVSDPSQSTKNDILLIHGQDKTAEESVLKFIEELGLRALTVHEAANISRSLIENFGKASDIHFVILLVTPDTLSPLQDQSGERKAWANQNTIFELGYFLGRLGPGKVCVLYKEGMKITVDISGVENIPMDSRGGWRLLVAKEIKQTGIEIDLNKAI
jgi:predicted nucleotide-binding protein